eukprot:CAMPEP_0116079936 /NCGR_PEP_ID=MMETSP0327-20121206/1407_1 /TAXON_ID=44447 /ORGANISM="Pseudo-nitzschia delicatissima, Strain B596" /LENGTH=947 /DNA_ID=CAMNT_0003570593 /DNA_START=90 /DNA_END=2933 /DNA_ORIENTATION=-
MFSSPFHSEATMSPRTKFRRAVMSFFLVNFFALMTAIESFVVPPIHSNDIGVKTRIKSTTRSASTTATKLFQDLGGSSDSSGYMEFRSIPNQPFRNERKYNVSLLVIDHYDSFTYNLCDMLAQLTVDPPVVVAKDAIDAKGDDLQSFFEKYDGIVLSPGPGTPEEQPALSHSAITENPDKPVFGVCLGHQLMSLAYGGTVDRAPVPIHGQDHRIVQKDETQNKDKSNQWQYPSLFQDLPSSFRVVRYHSLCAYDLPESLSVTARSGDNVVQAIQHESNPHYGVQFHPESIGTENGLKLLDNFLRVVEKHKDDDIGKKDHGHSVLEAPLESEESQPLNSEASSRFRIMVRRMSSPDVSITPSEAFEKYYSRQSHSIWLDSSSYHTGRGELDILAAPSRSGDIIEYHIDDNTSGGQDILSRLEDELFGHEQDRKDSSSSVGWVTFEGDKSSLEWVQESDESTAKRSVDEVLPFNYRGGFLGFLGYEVRHDTQRYLQQLEGGVPNQDSVPESATDSDLSGDSADGFRVPTAAFFLARQSMVYHHPTAAWHLIGLAEEDDDIEENLEWMKSVARDFKLFTRNDISNVQASSGTNSQQKLDRPLIEFVPNRPKETYENDIEKCHEYIKKGDSYELCLTNQLEARVTGASISTFDLYKIIREVNPAPYSSYFRWNLSSRSSGNQKKGADKPRSTSLVICSSSPERFMSVSRQQPHPEMTPYLQAEAKPIKGTCARVMPENGVCLSDAEVREDDRRARSLELSLKNRAENLMIVDLLRNDMSRVCKTGSVHVSKLMDIESFATVHQMVSTIRGTLSDSYNSIDLLRASFPGGSMTGAPKIRTMEILEELEENVDRGAYSGSLGYLSVNGCMDMNIMIRSATVTPTEKKDEWNVSIGAGGAITALSDAEDEYDEMLLKARAVKEAVEKWVATIDSDEIAFDSGETVFNSTDIFVE